MGKPGKLYFIAGGMYSGKSALLSSNVETVQHTDSDIIIITYKDSERYTKNSKDPEEKKTGIISKTGFNFTKFRASNCRANIKVYTVKELCNTIPLKRHIDYIFIDECHLFDDLKDFIYYALYDFGITVYMAGLTTDYKQDPWPNIASIEYLVHKKIILKSVCSYCYLTKRAEGITQVRITKNKTQKSIGGLEQYKPICGLCLHEEEYKKKEGRKTFGIEHESQLEISEEESEESLVANLSTEGINTSTYGKDIKTQFIIKGDGELLEEEEEVWNKFTME